MLALSMLYVDLEALVFSVNIEHNFHVDIKNVVLSNSNSQFLIDYSKYLTEHTALGFASISLRQKTTKPKNKSKKKLCKILSYKKGMHKMFVKLTPCTRILWCSQVNLKEEHVKAERRKHNISIFGLILRDFLIQF